MLIGSSSSSQSFFDFSSAFAQTALIAARPAFELQFFATQDAVLNRLDEEIENVRNAVNTRAATAFLDLQVKQLQTELEGIEAYKAATDKKVSRISDTLAAVSDLLTLAAPGTVAEFDARLAETILLMETTKTPIAERYGIPDRLRAAKTDALAQLNGLVHNNFATQTDIDNVTAILTDIQNDYLASQAIVGGNANMAFTLQQSTRDTINELSRQSSNIRTEALDAATDEVKKKQEQFSQVLTMISLAFEASQEITNFIAQQISGPKDPEPGTIVSLVS